MHRVHFPKRLANRFSCVFLNLLVIRLASTVKCTFHFTSASSFSLSLFIFEINDRLFSSIIKYGIFFICDELYAPPHHFFCSLSFILDQILLSLSFSCMRMERVQLRSIMTDMFFFRWFFLLLNFIWFLLTIRKQNETEKILLSPEIIFFSLSGQFGCFFLSILVQVQSK